MSKPLVCLSRPISEPAFEILRPHVEVKVWPKDNSPTKKELLEFCEGAAGLISMLSDSIDQEFLKALPKLKVVANYAVGFNNIDIAYAKQQGIRIGNTPGVLTEATADLAICLLLMAARQAKPAIKNVEAGAWQDWQPLGFLGTDLRGKKLGIYGFGRIGQAMARIAARAWDMQILAYRRNPEPQELGFSFDYVDFEELISESDVLSLHAPLSNENTNLFSENVFTKMKLTSILINTARGELVCNSDLYEALLSKKIAAAAVDVNNPEPMPKNEPLLGLDNFVALPHIGSATTQARSAMAKIAAENILAALRSEKMPAEIL